MSAPCFSALLAVLTLQGSASAVFAAPASIASELARGDYPPFDRSDPPAKPAKSPKPGVDPKQAESDKSKSSVKLDTTNGWTIVLAVLRGEDQTSAGRILERFRTEGGLPDAYLQKRTQATLIAYGLYPSSEDTRAQADLKRIQEMSLGSAGVGGSGLQPYSYVFLAPPAALSGAALDGQIPQYNLARVKQMYGPRALQSLQVAVYGRDDINRPTDKDLAEVRRAAEKACAQLRQDGEQAFYYHGPTRSMVTLGIFDLTDFDPQKPGMQSARLRDAKKRHPYNLYNGAAIKEKRPGIPESLQPSFLVGIPDK